MKKATALILAVIFAFSVNIRIISAKTDNYILSDPREGEYTGTLEADEILYYLNYKDVAANHWARRAIVRDTALHLASGDNQNYRPETQMTNQEAIAFIMKAAGYEALAVEQAATVIAQDPNNPNLTNMWALGYLSVASTLGIITPAEFADAITQTDIAGNPRSTFFRLAPAARENVALWLYKAMLSVDPTSFPTDITIQKIYSYPDYNTISPVTALAVENITMQGIMSGFPDGTFRPKDTITRAQMASILCNLDSIYFKAMTFTRKTAVVGTVVDNQLTENGVVSFWRNIYLRKADGGVDVLRYEKRTDTSPQSKDKDAVTYYGGSISGMSALKEGHVVEYITTADNKVLFVEIKSDYVVKHTQGDLYSVSYDDRSIVITDKAGKHFAFYVAEGLFESESNIQYLIVDNDRREISKLPYGSGFSLKLNNNTVVEISYVGEETMVNETRGIVIENDPNFGYLTILDNSGNELTQYYYEDELTVEKTEAYDVEDEIGYIDSMFPDFRYDPRDTDITQIEAGDVVFLRYTPEGNISYISASTNYTARYGKIVSIRMDESGEFAELIIKYENGQTASFDVSSEIFVSQDGKQQSFDSLLAGDWVKLLVNQAILAPGYVIESVKEIVIEGTEHFISNIVKGNFAGVNNIQKQIMIQNSYVLTNTGWGEFKDLSNYSLVSADIEYYNNGKRISLDYAIKYFKNSDLTVYVALENNFAGERVRIVSFRSGRDELMSPDTVYNSDGNGGFETIASGSLATDLGTIVRRHGRLVDGKEILAADYARIAVNGLETAAVVDIYDMPDVSQINIARGRILSIDEGKSFKVQSMSVLSGTNWIYTPVSREFTIDHNTVFINEEGLVNRDEFIGYTDASKVDKVYYIVFDGSRATRITEASYAAKTIRGTVYGNAEGVLSLRNAEYLDDKGVWQSISRTNSVMTVTYLPNTITAKNNSLIPAAELLNGDVVTVFTPSIPTMQSGAIVAGSIILVEK